jgi:hypothetical protein
MRRRLKKAQKAEETKNNNYYTAILPRISKNRAGLNKKLSNGKLASKLSELQHHPEKVNIRINTISSCATCVTRLA